MECAGKRQRHTAFGLRAKVAGKAIFSRKFYAFSKAHAFLPPAIHSEGGVALSPPTALQGGTMRRDSGSQTVKIIFDERNSPGKVSSKLLISAGECR